MDQGLAAVLGASVGVTGTLGTALLAYVAARRQAIDQGKIEHGKQLRTERREAYLTLIQAAEPVDRALHKIAHRDDVSGVSMESAPDDAVIRSAIEDLGTAAHEIYKSHARVDLAGPKAMRLVAVEVWAATRDLRSFLEAVLRGAITESSYQDRCEEVVDAVERSRTRFAEEASRVMEIAPGQHTKER
ncbi:hypothetical protein OG496_31470 [Streptomyces sp. NBC_00988]|uniref:hypothetical protein n=1 Tax=Streptomyces sp. NBC_00988 TaxID=2903704 RepID=UPI003870D987|nr:hypothetical protein OG496_31470 [Streptomyces sp. NBC_00988]